MVKDSKAIQIKVDLTTLFTFEENCSLSWYASLFHKYQFIRYTSSQCLFI